MSDSKLLPHYTYDDYRKWEGRWELIDGIPFAMSPAPSLRHQWVNANIISTLKQALAGISCRQCKVFNFIDIKITNNTIVQPDCSIVCGDADGNFLDFPPALVVEILSKSTAIKDRHTKYTLYEDFGVKYYLMADPKKEETEIFHLEDGRYRELDIKDSTISIMLDADCNLQINLRNFWE